ncbi:MAG: hypothetical protein PHP97_01485 [Candidatus Shapirobacteria bacterium]|nr:hypothetical protein [Candidatus Shapirobacteria bacterium]
MELSVLFVCVLLVIVMMGLLTVELFKKADKKQIVFIFFIYLVVLIRISLDVYILYFSLNIINWVSCINFLLAVIPGMFFYINREKTNILLLYAFFICFVIFFNLNLLSLFVPFMITIYYINLVLFAFYNILLYLLILSFLINIRHDG